MTLFEFLAPLIELTTIIAFLAVTFGAVWLFLEKTHIGAVVKAWTPWMGWDIAVQDEDDYTNFVIHRANYIRVPR